MSKEKLLLIGAGGFGRVVSELAAMQYDCAFVDDGIASGTEICGLPVLGGTADLPRLFPTYRQLVVTIGCNAIRERLYRAAAEIGYAFPPLRHPSADVRPYARLGEGCVLLQHTTVQNGASVGSGVLLNPGVEIHHESFVDDNALIYTNSVIRTMARVGKRVRIGSNVTVSNDVVVADDADVKNGETLY